MTVRDDFDFAAILVHVNAGDHAVERSAAARSWSRAAALLGLSEAGDQETLRAALEDRLGRPQTRLAAYGTLRPGQSNHHHVRDLCGPWLAGEVRGSVVVLPSGYPALRPGGTGTVPVEVLTSADLPAAWQRLDAFEGADYRRELVAVRLVDGTLRAAHAYLDAGRSRPAAPVPAPPGS